MTMALPPEYVDRLMAGQNGHLSGDLDFQLRQLLFVRPTLAFFNPIGADWNPHQLARLNHFIKLYKDFVRPFMSTSRIYHHTPTFSGSEPHGWGVIELASEDHSRAIAGLFQLSNPKNYDFLIRMRGLELSRNYQVTFDNTRQSCKMNGYALMQDGIKIRLEGALTSELLIFNSV